MVKSNYLRFKIFEWKKEILKYKFHILLSVLILIVANIINYFAGSYVTNKANCQEVPDLILGHFGPYPLSFLFVWGFIIVILVMLFYTLFFKIKEINTIVIQFSTLVVIRSIFILFTHLQTPSDAAPSYFPGLIINLFNFQNDLFFSGHVAMAFLGFLMFKEDKIRYFFLISSIMMGTIVLATHRHYSIDVFAAYFITYGSYKIVNFFSNKIKFMKEK
jgi:hypothetical protein